MIIKYNLTEKTVIISCETEEGIKAIKDLFDGIIKFNEREY